MCVKLCAVFSAFKTRVLLSLEFSRKRFKCLNEDSSHSSHWVLLWFHLFHYFLKTHLKQEKRVQTNPYQKQAKEINRQTEDNLHFDRIALIVRKQCIQT